MYAIRSYYERIRARLEHELLHWRRASGERDAQLAALEQRKLELERQLRAIYNSRPWKLIQALRRLFGRQW